MFCHVINGNSTIANVNADIVEVKSELNTFEGTKGEANKIVPLDSNALVPVANLPEATPTTIGALYGSSTDDRVAFGYGALALGGHSMAVGMNVLSSATTATANNTVVGNESANTRGSLTTGTNNVILGFLAGGDTLIPGSNNIIIGALAAYGGSDVSNTIVLGYNQQATKSNQLIVGGVTNFNIAGLAAAADGTGTLVSYDSSGNVSPLGGTHNTVTAIETAFASLTAPPFMSWLSSTHQTVILTSSSATLTIWNIPYNANSSNMTFDSHWKCPTAGLWELGANFGWSASQLQVAVQFQLFVNNTLTKTFTNWYDATTSGSGLTVMCQGTCLNLNAGDTLYWAAQGAANYTSGLTTIDVGGDNNESEWHAKYLGSSYTAA